MSTGSIRHNIEITDSADAERFVEALEKAKAESEEGMEISELLEIAKKGNLTDCGQRKCADIIEAQQREIDKLKDTIKGNYAIVKALTADKDEQAGRIMELEKSLKKIANPIPYMREEAESSGCALDGMMAIRLSEDPHYYREIAQKAIDALLGGKEDV